MRLSNFKITAARQLFKLYQGKIRFNAGGITIHHQPNCSRWRNHGSLCISVPMFFPQTNGIFPGCGARPGSTRAWGNRWLPTERVKLLGFHSLLSYQKQPVYGYALPAASPHG